VEFDAWKWNAVAAMQLRHFHFAPLWKVSILWENGWGGLGGWTRIFWFIRTFGGNRNLTCGKFETCRKFILPTDIAMVRES
jgi:hypothetical protein